MRRWGWLTVLRIAYYLLVALAASLAGSTPLTVVAVLSGLSAPSFQPIQLAVLYGYRSEVVVAAVRWGWLLAPLGLGTGRTRAIEPFRRFPPGRSLQPVCKAGFRWGAPRWSSGSTPYVPRLAAEWDLDAPGARWRQLEATCCFVDISGFTALSERLARRGRIGAEELTEVLNHVFSADARGRVRQGWRALEIRR